MQAIMPSSESDPDYDKRVNNVFETCATVLEELDPRKRFGDSLFLTFACGDPNDTMLAEEKKFVARMNSPEVFAQWCGEFD